MRDMPGCGHLEPGWNVLSTAAPGLCGRGPAVSPGFCLWNTASASSSENSKSIPSSTPASAGAAWTAFTVSLKLKDEGQCFYRPFCSQTCLIGLIRWERGWFLSDLPGIPPQFYSLPEFLPRCPRSQQLQVRVQAEKAS